MHHSHTYKLKLKKKKKKQEKEKGKQKKRLVVSSHKTYSRNINAYDLEKLV